MEVTQADIIKMTDFLGEIHDPRRQQGNFRHNLIDILVIGLSTVISGQDEFEAMEELGLFEHISGGARMKPVAIGKHGSSYTILPF